MTRYNPDVILRMSLKIAGFSRFTKKPASVLNPPRRASNAEAGITVGPSPCATFRRSVADGLPCRKLLRSGLLASTSLA
jgi:hypothetical protein